MVNHRGAHRLAAALAALILAASLSGCALLPALAGGRRQPAEPVSTPRPASSATAQSSASSSPSSTPESSSGSASSSGSSSSSSRLTVQERMRLYREQQREGQSSSSSSGSSSSRSSSSSSSGSSSSRSSSSSSSGSSSSRNSGSSSSGSSSSQADPEQAGPSLSEIARLVGLQASVEIYSHRCKVKVDKDENPYDVTWDYGPLYDAYIDSVDWELLFDAEYYKEAFPALAYLYHQDEALLLRHFQTVGIHEGRQGNEDFNVQAYMQNCGSKVKKAFGDEYACYYLYYAMNYKTEKKVTATGAQYPKQLTAKLTNMQQTELKNINKYRAEVGVEPLEFDSELAALACYRAYIDALEDWDAHDWMKANRDEIDGMMEMIDAYNWSENTVHGYPIDYDYAERLSSTAWYIKYRNSKDHYDAMVNSKYHYTGNANCYISYYEKENPKQPDAEAVYVHYDVFVDDLTTALHN